MNKLKQKIINADYTKLLKRWLVLALCVVLSGGLSAVMLQTQIGEVWTVVQNLEHADDQWENHHDASAQKVLENSDEWEEHQFPEAWNITEPSPGAKIAVGITVLLGCLAGAVFWLLVAAWLYQMAIVSEMNGLFWGLLGLGGSVFAVVVFLMVRSFIRRKCPACGRWQKAGSFCRACGTMLKLMCPACGAECETEDTFCTNCGISIENEKM